MGVVLCVCLLGTYLQSCCWLDLGTSRGSSLASQAGRSDIMYFNLSVSINTVWKTQVSTDTSIFLFKIQDLLSCIRKKMSRYRKVMSVVHNDQLTKILIPQKKLGMMEPTCFVRQQLWNIHNNKENNCSFINTI